MTDVLKTTVGDLLDEKASAFPDREVLIDIPQGKRFTYREFLNHINQLAKRFLKLGLQKKKHLAL